MKAVKSILPHLLRLGGRATPVQPNVPPAEGEDESPTVDRNVEVMESEWKPIIVLEQSAKDGDSHSDSSMVAAVNRALPAFRRGLADSPSFSSEVGSVALKSVGKLRAGVVAVERVLSFVADPFPWEQVEEFASDLLNGRVKLRILRRTAQSGAQPFDYVSCGLKRPLAPAKK